MKNFNSLKEMELTQLSHSESNFIEGGDFQSGYNAGYSFGKSFWGAFAVIGVYLTFAAKTAI